MIRRNSFNRVSVGPSDYDWRCSAHTATGIDRSFFGFFFTSIALVLGWKQEGHGYGYKIPSP
jgi:hypothetical protein